MAVRLMAAVTIAAGVLASGSSPVSATRGTRTGPVTTATPGRSLWLGNDRHGDVYQTDLTGTPLRVISKPATGVATDGTHLYLANWFGSLEQLDLDTGQTTQTYTIPGGELGEDLAWDPSRQLLWWVDHSGILRSINPVDGSVVSTFALPIVDPGGTLTPLGALGLAYDSSRDLLDVSFCKSGCDTSVVGGLVEEVSPATGEVLDVLFRSTSSLLGGLAYDPTNDSLWVGDLTSVRDMTRSGALLSSFTRPGIGFVDGLEMDSAPPSGEEIAETYAPFVYLHPQEHSFPNDAGDFIRHSRLRWSHDSCSDHAVENADGSDASYDAIDQSRLGAAADDQAYSHPGDIQILGQYVCQHGSTDYLANQYTRPRDGGSSRETSGAEGMFLDLKNGEHHGNSNLGADPIYYDYAPRRYIVFWFFYNYDDGIQKFNHEGDWEHIAVQLDANSQAIKVAYYHHACGPRIKSWPELEGGDGTSFGLYQGTHPIVFSAKGVHGSYPNAGIFFDSPSCQFQVDYTDLSTYQWSTWTNVRSVKAEPWYGFGGAWGDVGNPVPFADDVTTGPLGPSSYKGPGVPDGW